MTRYKSDRYSKLSNTDYLVILPLTKSDQRFSLAHFRLH